MLFAVFCGNSVATKNCIWLFMCNLAKSNDRELVRLNFHINLNMCTFHAKVKYSGIVLSGENIPHIFFGINVLRTYQWRIARNKKMNRLLLGQNSESSGSECWIVCCLEQNEESLIAGTKWWIVRLRMLNCLLLGIKWRIVYCRDKMANRLE